MKKTILFFAGLAFLTFKNQAQTVTDYDGNVYNTVTIGTQVWLKENLKVTHYRNGDPIPNVTDNTWGNLITGAYCNYNNDTNNSTTYGRLYNWFAATDAHKICPTGWHVPSDGEWNILEKYLDNTVDTTTTGWVGTDIGGKLKETGTTHWNSPNTGATNSSGFTALPGGTRDNFSAFEYIRDYGFWWSSSEISAYSADNRSTIYSNSNVYMGNDDKSSGFSVRCVRDNSNSIEDINYQEKLYIYPNPAIDRVYINCAEKQDFKMQVYSMIGECVLQRELSSGTNDIDISSLSKGIYIIKLTGTDWTLQRKLTKE
jgi:uncharacterized protein (TIGR02145 family)